MGSPIENQNFEKQVFCMLEGPQNRLRGYFSGIRALKWLRLMWRTERRLIINKNQYFEKLFCMLERTKKQTQGHFFMNLDPHIADKRATFNTFNTGPCRDSPLKIKISKIGLRPELQKMHKSKKNSPDLNLRNKNFLNFPFFFAQFS